MVTEQRGRAAAWVAAAIFVVVAGVQFYAVIHEAFTADPPPVRDLIGAALMGLLALAAAAVLLVRVGYWRAHVSFEVGRRYAWWVAYIGLGGGGGWLRGADGCRLVHRRTDQPHPRAARLRGRALRVARVTHEPNGAEADWQARFADPVPLELAADESAHH